MTGGGEPVCKFVLPCGNGSVGTECVCSWVSLSVVDFISPLPLPSEASGVDSSVESCACDCFTECCSVDSGDCEIDKDNAGGADWCLPALVSFWFSEEEMLAPELFLSAIRAWCR